jgi:2-(3-amino-3-carboxypropyl)histidine synthase
LTRAGKLVAVGDTGRLPYPGQIIGCDYSNAKSIAKDVEAFLFIGGGQFHAIGVALSTSKPTIVADPYDGSAYQVNNEANKIFRQRWASIEQSQKGKIWAILVGLKLGQKRFDRALQLKERLEAKGKTACLFAVREIVPEALMEFPTVEVYVNTACPRISLDDACRFAKPVLTVDEALVVIGDLSWEELCKKGLFEN